MTIRLEIITPLPTTLRPCLSCERLMEAQLGDQVHLEMLREYPPELREEAERLRLWVEDLLRRYGNELQVRLLDPQSLEGLWKCLRHRVRRYPAFIVQGRRRVNGWDRAALEQAMEEVRGSP